MFKKLYLYTILWLSAISNFLTAEQEFIIEDIGTLQTRESTAIAINNNGQILGFYNINNTPAGKHAFLREKDGTFIEIPLTEKDGGQEITWKYLTDNGYVYGSYYQGNFQMLFIWEPKSGIVNLGKLPGNEIVSINNNGQVLLKSILESENGKSNIRPVIWENGKITKLNGLEGNTGIPSDESYGFSMNNQGEVVGQSLIYLAHKNQIYKQVHATKWIKGTAIDLYNCVPKCTNSIALSINDSGDILIKTTPNQKKYVLKSNEIRGKECDELAERLDYAGNVYHASSIQDIRNHIYIACLENININLENDYSSIWKQILKIFEVNSNGEIIAEGETIYGEKHAVLLTPIKKHLQANKEENVGEKTEFIKLLDYVLFEIDFNLQSGVGDKDCPFKIDAHLQLYLYAGKYNLDTDLRKKIKDIIYLAELCNGGIRKIDVTPNDVKAKTLELREKIKKLINKYE